jgi:Fur family ferric uptake transcriptional regulator
MPSRPATIGRVAFGGRRVSTQREAIAQAAARYCGSFSAEDLHAAVSESAPGIGIATVYRAVSAMEHAGFIEPVGARHGATVYVQCEVRDHHHHVVCTSCGAVAEAECSVSATAACDTGFTITGHELTLYGLCPRCQR